MEKKEIEKIKNQIEKAQKYLLSFSGNETKTYAVKQRIFKLKDKIGDTSPTYQLGPYGPYVSRQESKMENIIHGFELVGVIPNRVETYHDTNTHELVASITPIHADKYEVKVSEMTFITPTMDDAKLLIQSFLKRRVA